MEPKALRKGYLSKISGLVTIVIVYPGLTYSRSALLGFDKLLCTPYNEPVPSQY
jgi:hypothetical protein